MNFTPFKNLKFWSGFWNYFDIMEVGNPLPVFTKTQVFESVMFNMLNKIKLSFSYLNLSIIFFTLAFKKLKIIWITMDFRTIRYMVFNTTMDYYIHQTVAKF